MIYCVHIGKETSPGECRPTNKIATFNLDDGDQDQSDEITFLGHILKQVIFKLDNSISQ